MTEALPETQKQIREKLTLRILLICIAGCLLYGIISGFRSDMSVIIGIITTNSDSISYTDLQIANSVYRFVSAVASPVVAFLTLKRSNFFVLTIGFILTLAGIICISVASYLPLLIFGLGVLFALGSASLSFGIIFGIISPLVGEKVAIVLSTVFTLAATFFGVIFSPLIQGLSDLLGYQAMLGVFCFVLICMFPLVFVISGKKKEAVVSKQKRDIRFKDAMSLILKNKVIYILIAFFFIIGFTSGINNHFYTGTLILDILPMQVSMTFSLLKITMAVSSIVLTIVVLRIKRMYLFAALICLLFSVTEFLISFLPKDTFAHLPFVFIATIICSAYFPISNLIIRREFSPVLIGFVICFTSLFEKVGAGINSILGSLFFEWYYDFTLLGIIESTAGLILAIFFFIFILKSKDVLKKHYEERKMAEEEAKRKKMTK